MRQGNRRETLRQQLQWRRQSLEWQHPRHRKESGQEGRRTLRRMATMTQTAARMMARMERLLLLLVVVLEASLLLRRRTQVHHSEEGEWAGMERP